MKVVLRKDIPGTGKKDQIVEVSDGYGRNYLLPRKLAVEATSEQLNSIRTARAAEAHRNTVRMNEAELKARELKGKVILITAKGGGSGKLYGAITGAEICAAIKEQHNVDIDKKKIELSEPIKAAGQYFATLKLAPGISTRMIVSVVTEN